MAYYGYVTSKGREEIINREQTGAAAEFTLEERIAVLDKQIDTAKSWIVYYKGKKAAVIYSKESIAKLVSTHQDTVDRLEMKREILLAQLYASNMPDIGGAFVLYPEATS